MKLVQVMHVLLLFNATCVYLPTALSSVKMLYNKENKTTNDIGIFVRLPWWLEKG